MKVLCSTPHFDRIELKKEHNTLEIPLEWKDTIIEELIDGSVIRLYYDDEWKIATLHTTDADKAFWYSSKSFKELFLECSEQFLQFENLNKEYIYGFIIRHPENKIVTHYEYKDLVHIFTLNERFEEIDVDLKIIKPRKLIFNSFDQMIDACLKLSFYLPGFLVSYKQHKYKIISPHYTHVKNIKGNISSMKARYLQLRKTDEANEFLLYFPEMIVLIQEIESNIIKKVQDLYQKYVDIKIKKEWIDLEKIEKQIIYKVHEIYLNTKEPITFQHVYDYFNTLPYYKIALALNIPINNYRNTDN